MQTVIRTYLRTTFLPGITEKWPTTTISSTFMIPKPMNKQFASATTKLQWYNLPQRKSNNKQVVICFGNITTATTRHQSSKLNLQQTQLQPMIQLLCSANTIQKKQDHQSTHEIKHLPNVHHQQLRRLPIPNGTNIEKNRHNKTGITTNTAKHVTTLRSMAEVPNRQQPCYGIS